MKVLRRWLLLCFFAIQVFSFLSLPVNDGSTVSRFGDDPVTRGDDYDDNKSSGGNILSSANFAVNGLISEYKGYIQTNNQSPLFLFLLTNALSIFILNSIVRIIAKIKFLYLQEFFDSVFHPPKALLA